MLEKAKVKEEEDKEQTASKGAKNLPLMAKIDSKAWKRKNLMK